MAEVAAPSRAASAEWRRCPACAAFVYHKRLKRNLHVCPECNHHFRLRLRERLDMLLDPDSFEELSGELEPVDALAFVDSKPYPERIAAAQKKTGSRGRERSTARGTIDELPLVVAGIDFGFIGGSMGGAVGEAITRAAELALEERMPLLVISASGGARMQEGCISLMQMAKTSQAIARLNEEGVLYISLLTDPTYGGVSASFATLGDVLIAEPGTRIGFAGPSVIEQTIRQKLPEGFQTAGFLMEHGMLDLVETRENLRRSIRTLLSSCTRPPRARGTGGSARAESLPETEGADPVSDADALTVTRPVGRGPARAQHRAPAHARLRRLRLRRLHRAARRPPVRGGPGDRRRPGAARRPPGDADRPPEGPHHRRDDGAQLRHARARGLPQGHAADALRGQVSACPSSPSSTPPAPTRASAPRSAASRTRSPSRSMLMSRLPVPLVTVVTGEGGSGGALALAAADRVLMLENSYYSVISPEGCATILFKDAPRRRAPPPRCGSPRPTCCASA